LTVYEDGSLAPIPPAPPRTVVPILVGIVLLVVFFLNARAMRRREGRSPA
jgi:hypothetical protein